MCGFHGHGGWNMKIIDRKICKIVFSFLYQNGWTLISAVIFFCYSRTLYCLDYVGWIDIAIHFLVTTFSEKVSHCPNIQPSHNLVNSSHLFFYSLLSLIKALKWMQYHEKQKHSYSWCLGVRVILVSFYVPILMKEWFLILIDCFDFSSSFKKNS